MAFAVLPAGRSFAAEPRSSLVIIVDGLRPDYITPQIMPNLHALGESGFVGEAHHAVFPTVTRVNSSSISTGAYPGTHGVMHNTIHLPTVSPKPVETGDALALLDAESKLGRLLTAPTISELLVQAGKKVLIASSGSSGAALLLNPKPSAHAAILNRHGFVRPEGLRERAERVLGPPPPAGYPNRAGVRWGVDAYLEIGLKEFQAEVTFLWITDPDGTAHRYGVGAPETLDALRNVDNEVGRIVGTLAERGVRDRVNIFVTSDHGFSTQGGPFNLSAVLTARGLSAGVKVIGGSQIYVEGSDKAKIRRIVQMLQELDWVGAIFTRAAKPGSSDGFVPGTLSFDAIHYQHERAADILVDTNWSHTVNAHGYAGTTTAGGVASHGSSSPYDIRIRLIAAGPDIQRGKRSQVPTGNIDLAPTLCHLHGIKPAPTMAGRVLKELLRDGSAADAVRVDRRVHRVATDTANGRYELALHKASVGTTEYVSYGETKR